MKYILILGDGMADHPISELGNKTPLEVANTPYMDFIASHGEIGLVKTIPEGMSPGSDTANLAVLGYDPKKYYTGRSPLEAVSMGVVMESADVSFRTNLVTLSGNEEPFEKKILLDHSAGEITTDEAKILLDVIKANFDDHVKNFYSGISYRHLLLWKKGDNRVQLTPPHDIKNKTIEEYLPKGHEASAILDMMKRSYDLLENHPINRQRKKNGLNPANAIWIWGEGTKPTLDSFYGKYGLKGAMISAVDLLKGIGKCSGLEVIEVEGATGNIHTNYEGKADAAIEALMGELDFVYVHIEAPDECSHMGHLEDKIKAIERIDSQIIKPIMDAMDESCEDYRILVLPDHPTPIHLCTHTDESVPYTIYDSSRDKKIEGSYDEKNARISKQFFNTGYALMDYFVKGGKESC